MITYSKQKEKIEIKLLIKILLFQSVLNLV